MTIPVGPLPPRKVATPNRANYCSIAILHLFPKKLETWKAPPKNSSGTTLGKGNGIKLGAIRNTLEERIENLGNIIGNMIGTQAVKKLHPHTSPPASSPKGKKMNPLGRIFSQLIGCMHILFLDMAATIFVPQLIPLLQSTLYPFWGYLFCSILIS